MLSFSFCSFKENVYRVLINIVQLAFSPKWLSTGEMLKTCIFFAYDQLLPITCNWPLNDRTLNSSLADAREAFINVCVDAIERWKVVKKHSFPPIEWSCTSRAPDSWCCRSLTPSSTCQVQCINQPGVLPSSSALKLLPLLVLAALKSPAFRWSQHFVFWKCWLFLSTTAPALAWSWTREARRWSRWSVCLSPAPSRPFTLTCTGKYWMRSF